MTINTYLTCEHAKTVLDNITIPESNSSDWIYTILFDNSDYELTTNYSPPALIDKSPPLKRRRLERGAYSPPVSPQTSSTPSSIIYQFIPYLEPSSTQQKPDAASQKRKLVKPLNNLPSPPKIKSNSIATNSFSFFNPGTHTDTSVSWDFDSSQSNKNQSRQQVNYGFGQLTINNSELESYAYLFK